MSRSFVRLYYSDCTFSALNYVHNYILTCEGAIYVTFGLFSQGLGAIEIKEWFSDIIFTENGQKTVSD